MDRTSIDLRLISCKGIKSFNLFQKPSLSATVSIADQKKRTASDPDGGRNPEWTESFRFDLDLHRQDLSLEIEIFAQGNLLIFAGERVVGRVKVPIEDLMKEGEDGSVHHVSYRVEGTDGKPNGVIRFSFNVNREAVTLPVGDGGYRPPLPHQLDPVVSFPVGSCYPTPRQQDPVIAPFQGHYPIPRLQHPLTSSTAATDYYPPPRQQDPTMQLGDRYPPIPRQQYRVTSSIETDYYPPLRQQDSLISSTDHYPMPRQQDPVSSSRAIDVYPPPRQHDSVISSTVEDYYSRTRQLYPAPRPQEPLMCYPPPGRDVGCYVPTAPPEHVAYPAPSAPPEPASCYPPPQAAYCYSAPVPPQHDGYRSESWDRWLY